LSIRKLSSRQIIRILGLVVLVTLFAGMIAYSACRVRYRVNGAPSSELVVTNLSLTHCVERTDKGDLINPYAEKPVQSSPVVVQTRAPGAVMLASASAAPSIQELAAKSAPKKAAPKKPAPKKPTAKPAPKKPAKKPSAPKACPT